MFRITERVESEYGPGDYTKIADVFEPFGLLAFWAWMLILLFTALFS